MSGETKYRIFPLSDHALTIEFCNRMDEGINKEIIQRFYWLRENSFKGLIEVVPAYCSLTVYYDLSLLQKLYPHEESIFHWMQAKMENFLKSPVPPTATQSKEIEVPVCYEAPYAPDLDFVASYNHISREEVIRHHTSVVYHVYMLGFLPGFPYLGETPPAIESPRKDDPVPVAAGSIGIAGRQTGIYPVASPGGWQVIGRTPLRIFDPGADELTLINAGDRVRFISISKHEFENY